MNYLKEDYEEDGYRVKIPPRRVWDVFASRHGNFKNTPEIMLNKLEKVERRTTLTHASNSGQEVLVSRRRRVWKRSKTVVWRASRMLLSKTTDHFPQAEGCEG